MFGSVSRSLRRSSPSSCLHRTLSFPPLRARCLSTYVPPSKLNDVDRQEKLTPLLSQGWSMVEDRDAITKTFMFKDFKESFSFMTRVALLAEEGCHHPEWFNVYNKVEVGTQNNQYSGLDSCACVCLLHVVYCLSGYLSLVLNMMLSPLQHDQKVLGTTLFPLTWISSILVLFPSLPPSLSVCLSICSILCIFSPSPFVAFPSFHDC